MEDLSKDLLRVKQPVANSFAIVGNMSKDLADSLRHAIEKSGQSVNEIAKASGVPQTTLARFMRGFDMSIHRASKVARYLRLELKKK